MLSPCLCGFSPGAPVPTQFIFFNTSIPTQTETEGQYGRILIIIIIIEAAISDERAPAVHTRRGMLHTWSHCQITAYASLNCPCFKQCRTGLNVISCVQHVMLWLWQRWRYSGQHRIHVWWIWCTWEIARWSDKDLMLYGEEWKWITPWYPSCLTDSAQFSEPVYKTFLNVR